MGRGPRRRKNHYAPVIRPVTKRIREEECFWCGGLLKIRERTDDHLVPRAVGGGRTVPACEGCNGERGYITHFVKEGHLRIHHATVKRKWEERRAKWFNQTRPRVVELVAKYRTLLAAQGPKIGADELAVCLDELRYAEIIVERLDASYGSDDGGG